jgi:predicted RNA-binding protein with PUA-like domain
MASSAKPSYWLMKSEPDAYSIDDLARAKRGSWDGVRNYQARNNMRAMREGDLVLFYHSQVKPPAVVGVARVCREAYPDPTAFDPNCKYFDPKSSPDNPRWDMVDVEFVEKLPEPVTLEQLKEDPAFEGMLVTTRGRLSVQPVDRTHFEQVLERGGGKTKVPRA